MSDIHEDPEMDLSGDLSGTPIKRHLLPTIQRWNDDGTRNDITPSPNASDSSSQPTTASNSPYPASNLDGEHTESTAPSTQGTDDIKSSSMNATYGGTATVRSVGIDTNINEKERFDGDNDNKATRFSLLRVDVSTRKRGYSRTASENSGEPSLFLTLSIPAPAPPSTNHHTTKDFRNDIAHHPTPRISPTRLLLLLIFNILLILILILILTSLTTLPLSTYTSPSILSHNSKTTLGDVKFGLILDTYIIAFCVCLFAILLRRRIAVVAVVGVGIVLVGGLMGWGGGWGG
ncbi:hypothetical protein Vi05172_g885 [Venturia inaequalis]|nr:hypothetical protein Vi05172_g885 [Venturia inaequalis]